ncbi:MarR family winged helix-turn-helix transcriptional regulator [Paenibacillus alba]|uniref:MarR family winged helix-turn-helix transcriptional regulator n=1 Tax=Paenibacillus alba TaxID=1197127 RepID=A0ABU6G055_9BACL|nr:MarR family winged helix-turn-helix transcriptional regulator [Paenibacillus alba]MEC0226692.1 MarR family winged helix-turn-helix transcriptional regulator [Paenibacillus alba]
MDNKAFFHKLVLFTAGVLQVKHDFTKDVKPDTITPVQYGILEYLAVSQPVTLSQISDCQHMSMPNTSREMKKLTEKKLCEKTIDPNDQRKHYIRLSPEGQAMMNNAFQIVEARFLERVQAATEEEREAIERALDVLHSKVFY